MSFPGEKYPLDMGEQNCLISNMLASECLLLLIGVVGSMAASGVVSGDWFGSIVGFGWAHEIALSCMKLSAIDTIVAAIVVTVIALAVAHAIEFVASHTTSGKLSISMAKFRASIRMPCSRAWPRRALPRSFCSASCWWAA